MKRILNPRPVAFLAFFFIVGIAASYYLNLPVYLILPLCLISGGLFAFCLCTGRKQVFFCFYLLFFFFGAFLFQVQFKTDLSQFEPNVEYQIQGYVSDRSKMNAQTHTYTLTNVQVSGEKLDKSVILYSPASLSYGDTVLMSGEIEQPSPPRNPGDFDEAMYLAGKGAGFSLYQTSVEVIGNHVSWYQYPFLLREKMAEKIDAVFSEVSAPVAKAMFLGIKDEIPQEMREQFSKTGIAHILAISGLHVAIISYAFNFLLKKMKAERRIRFLLNISLLVLYAALTGFAPSILRAVLMTVFVIIGRWRFSKRDTLVFLSAALLVTLFINTAQLFSPGLLMSYGVVFGILCLNPPLKRIFHRIKLNKVRLDTSLATSISATASVFPMTAYFFNNIALAAPLANFFAIPLAGIIVLFTGAGTLLAFLSPLIGKFFAFPAELSIRGLTWLNEKIAQSSLGFIEVTHVPVWLCFFVMAFIFLCSDYVLVKRRTKLFTAGAMAAVFLFVSMAFIPQSAMRVTVLDVGTGDAIHIETDGRDYLIDNGGNIQYSNVRDYAEENKIVFDAVIVTNDRTKNLNGLAEDERIKALYVPGNYIEKEYDTQYPVKEYGIYDKIHLEDESFLEVIGSDGKYLSLLLCYKDQPICLFEQTLPEDMRVDEKVPVLKVAGGGKAGAVTEELLRTIQPQYAILSVKKDNKRQLPALAVTDLLFERQIEVLSTADSGAVTIEISEQGEISLRTEM
ncbi:ComEC/Rec2 family competence protein [Christensenella massiliensis]|uniref:ComEC/Rec2 family competence protein n=1 Tax=Christensenella massiliensis TaxID=1805714 RepID=A0AAU8A8Q5_9FIRM